MIKRRAQTKSKEGEVCLKGLITEARGVLNHGIEDRVGIDVDDGCGGELVGEESQLLLEEAVIENHGLIEGACTAVLVQVRSRVRELGQYQWQTPLWTHIHDPECPGSTLI